MAEDLQRFQTRIAGGDESAYPAEMAELKAMAEAIAGAKPESFASRREADSLVLYILSGGATTPVVQPVENDALVASERSLARGALAYVTNHEADALELFAPLNIAALDARIAGPVAFARSVMKTKRDPKAAIADLDWARLAAPGGLVEEAALRREIMLLAEARDAPRVAMLTRQYAERFPSSPYASNFFHEFARQIARTGLADDPENYRLLSEASGHMATDGRRDFLLTLARAAALNGRFDAAAAAAGEVLRNTAPGGPEDARGRLYLDVGRIFSDAYDGAISDLRGIAVSKLDPSDAALLAAARNVAAQLRAPVAAAGAQAKPASGDAHPESEPPTIAKAEEALRRTERLAAPDAGDGP
jgi:chemotaxis protein MotC